MTAHSLNLPALLVADQILTLTEPGRKTAREAIDDYFGAKIANDNTRAAYLRDAREFGKWIVAEGKTLQEVRTIDVAKFRDHLRNRGNSPATLKRKISGVWKLLSYLVKCGTLPYNPAREVTTEPVRRREGKTPALDQEQMRTLFKSFRPLPSETDDSHDEGKWRLIDLRDRAIIGVMAYTFARVSAVCSLRVQDYLDLGRNCVLRLDEKGGIERDIPVHPTLAEYIDVWRQAVTKDGVSVTGTTPPFPSFTHKGTRLSVRPLAREDVSSMVKSRLKRSGLKPAFSNHSFRATGITQFLEKGGKLETAQQIANHADSRTTKLYDRRATRLELSEIARTSY